MSRHNPEDRRRPVMFLGALALAATLAAPAPVAAAGPHPALPDVRDPGRAWDPQPARPEDASSARLIVRFKNGTTATERRTATDRPGVTRVEDLPTTHLAVVRTSAGSSRNAAIARLRADPNVARVSVDHRRYRDAEPQDEPGWTELWGLHNHGQRIYQGSSGTEGQPDVDIDGLQAFGVTTGDPAVVVAVIDDGVDFSHPDLAGRAWSNPGESGGGKETNGVDDDSNGFIDDVNGWDFCNDDNTVHDFDQDFHGTHVAGTIAASLDGVGVVGVAPSIRIMALKFLSRPEDVACGYDSQAIAAIAYAKSFGIAITNASWGGRGAASDAPELYDAIADSGMLFVASAGNEGIDNDHDPLPSIPASFDLPNILSVAAIDNSGFVADFSNYGATTVDIAAPGVGIVSALPADATYADPGWGWLDGTSMAAPHVTGTAALVISESPELAASPNELKARILNSGKRIARTTGRTLTGRTVDAFRALDTVAPAAKSPVTIGFAIGSTVSRSYAPARIAWPAGSDDLSGIDSYGLQMRTNTSAFANLVISTVKRTYDRPLKIGTAYAFKVRARDGGGNWSDYVGSASIRPVIYQESTSKAKWKGSWKGSSNTKWSGGRTRYATSAGASVTFTFTGRAFGLVAPKGSSRGKAKIYIDGAYGSTIDLRRSSTLARVVVAARTWATATNHTVKVVVVGGGAHPRVDIDALLVMR